MEAWRPDESSKTKSLDRELLRAHDKTKDKKDRTTWGRVRAIVQPRKYSAKKKSGRGGGSAGGASGNVTDGTVSDGATLETPSGDMEGYESYTSVADEEEETQRLRRAGSWRRRSQEGSQEQERRHSRERGHLAPGEVSRQVSREESCPRPAEAAQAGKEEVTLVQPETSRQGSREEGRLSPPDVSRRVSREEASRQSSREEGHDGAAEQVSLAGKGASESASVILTLTLAGNGYFAILYGTRKGINFWPFWLLCYRWFAHHHLALGGVQLPLPVLQWSEWTERTLIQTKQKQTNKKQGRGRGDLSSRFKTKRRRA